MEKSKIEIGLSQRGFAKQGITNRVMVLFAVTLLCVFSIFLFAFKTSERMADDVWRQLGLTQEQGSEKIKNAFLFGYIENAGFGNIRNISAGKRAVVAKDLLLYAKTYLNSTNFKMAYTKERAASKPEALEFVPISKDAIRKERIAELKRNIREAEEAVKKIPSLEKSVQKTVAGYQKAIKDYESPESKMLNIFYETAVSQQKHQQLLFDKKMKEWKANFPENPKEKVKRCLENFIAIAATVDFDAELVERNNKNEFLNMDYESKNADWKRIYRAGKDVYNAVKPIAEQWLKEIQ